MVSFTSITLLALAYASCLVNALPLVGRDSLDVAAPPVTYPTKGVVWKAGETQTVTWDISHLPDQITNPIGKVVLGWLEGDGLNLQLDTPLVQGFPITAGKVNLVVPSQYPDRDTYIIALIGSSGNISPAFTITGGSSTSDPVNPGSSSVSKPEVQPTSVPGSPPSKTPGSTSTPHDGSSPTPTSSTPSPSGPTSSSSKSSSSPSPSGTQVNSNGSASDNSSAWVNKPANTMVVSLLVASLVTLIL